MQQQHQFSCAALFALRCNFPKERTMRQNLQPADRYPLSFYCAKQPKNPPMDYVINLFLVSSSSSLVDVKLAERKKIRSSEGGYQHTSNTSGTPAQMERESRKSVFNFLSQMALQQGAKTRMFLSACVSIQLVSPSVPPKIDVWVSGNCLQLH